MTVEYGAPSDMVYKDTLRAEEYRRTVEQVSLFNAVSGGAIVLESDPARQMAEGGDFTETARFKPMVKTSSTESRLAYLPSCCRNGP